MTSVEPIQTDTPAARGCPFPHGAASQRRTAQEPVTPQPAVVRDADGVWHVHSFTAARTVLRSSETRQAGFRAEVVDRVGFKMRPPILFMEGTEHHQQRKQTARFFTPKRVSDAYRTLMEDLSDRVIAYMRTKQEVDLSFLSRKLAVRVAGEVVGLTRSIIPGMDRRLEALFGSDEAHSTRTIRGIVSLLRSQYAVMSFYYLDVLPSIRARRKAPREDVISHLLASGYTDLEIMTECITYGAAGMATTREFISVATWHMLDQPELREYYLQATEEERQQVLEELLRLEPVVGHLYRRATGDIRLDDGTVIPAGDLVNVHIYNVNADEQVTGDLPNAICPGREMRQPKAGAALMSFGDGHHRCPGAYIALQETDIFLQRLLRVPGLKVVQKPTITWNPLITGYEIRDFMVRVES